MESSPHSVTSLSTIYSLSIHHLSPTYSSIHLPTRHPSTHLSSLCPSIHHPSFYPSIHSQPTIYSSDIHHLFVHPSISIHPSIHHLPTIHSSVLLSSIHPLTCYTIYPSTHPSIHPFIIHSLPTINHSLLFCPYICLPTSHLQPATCPSVYLPIIHSHTSSSVFQTSTVHLTMYSSGHPFICLPSVYPSTHPFLGG